jgi:hypothetical protein
LLSRERKLLYPRNHLIELRRGRDTTAAHGVGDLADRADVGSDTVSVA